MTEMTQAPGMRETPDRPYFAWPGATAFAATLVAFVAVARFGFSARGLLDGAVCATLIVLAAIDLERRIIPNVIVVPATVLVLIAQAIRDPSRWYAYVGAAAGAGIFFLVVLLLFRDGLGMGDVKLAMLLGAALGTHVIAGLLLGSLAGGVAGLYLLVTKGPSARKMTIAFGPYLAAGAIVVLLFG